MARIDNQTSLTREQLETLAKVTKDVFFFSLFVYIVDIRLKKLCRSIVYRSRKK